MGYASREDDMSINIETWFADHHDCDLSDVLHIAQHAASTGNVREVNFEKAPFGTIIVVWSGDAGVSDKELVSKLEIAWDRYFCEDDKSD